MVSLNIVLKVKFHFDLLWLNVISKVSTQCNCPKLFGVMLIGRRAFLGTHSVKLFPSKLKSHLTLCNNYFVLIKRICQRCIINPSYTLTWRLFHCLIRWRASKANQLYPSKNEKKKKTRKNHENKKSNCAFEKRHFFISTYKCTLFKFPVNLYSIYVIIQYYLIASICQHPLTWIHQTVSTILLSILLFQAGLQETYLFYIVKTDTKLFIHAHQHLYYQ